LESNKTKPNTTNASIHQSKQKVLQQKINTKKLKPGLVAFYDIPPGNGAGLFSKEKTSKGGHILGKSEEKRIRGEAYDINNNNNNNNDRLTAFDPGQPG